MAPTGSISRAARSPVMYWSRASRTPPTPHGRNSWTTRTPTATISSRICSSSATAMTKPDGAISPPEQFKLLLYFPESDTFLCSTVTERYAFDSVYRLDLGGKSPAEVAALTLTDPNGDPLPTGTVTLDKADGTHQQIVGFFGRLGITLVIELALAWGWKYRKGSQLLFIGVANLVTQCLLNASLLYWGARETSRGAIIFWYILLELAVTGIEAAAYAYLLPGTDRKDPAVRRHAALYALSANLLSFLGGLALSELFPILF